jgi:hypothetical protein
MARTLACLPVPFLLALTTSAQAAGQSPADEAYLLTRLALDLRVDYERGAIGGTATLQVRNVSGRAGGPIPLLLNRLMIVSRVVGAAGEAIPFEQRVVMFRDDSARQVNAIVLAPGRPILPGDSLSVTVHYGGILVGYTETGSLYVRDRVNCDFTILREDAYAFPVLGVPDWSVNRAAPREPFEYVTRVTVPAGLVVAMGGDPDPPTREDSLVTWSTHSAAPVPFLNIAIAPYRVLERGDARIFYFPADSDGAQLVQGAVAGAVQRYTRWYGPLGHEPRLVVMEIPEGFGSQASLTAGILQTADAFRNRAELRQLYHELSHLWNVPDLDRPSPRWNEGLASFLQWRMAAELDGWADWDARLAQTVQSLLRQCAAPVRCDSVPLVEYGRAGLTDRSYSVGLLLFYVLSRAMGAEAFDRSYRTFFQRYRDRGATSADLAAVFRAVSPRSDRIFADWLFTSRWHARLAAGEPLAQIVAAYQH